MKSIRVFIPLILSIALTLPMVPIKSFNHSSDKNLVLENRIHDKFFHKISYSCE
ncbi:MAG: hypothetical protein MJA82_09235 [Clostridia bacterium]|nr:hypothetical protein [Clostridia bacterium]